MEWPKTDECLFRFETDWEYNACINCYAPNLGVFASNYKQAADALALAAANREIMLDCAIVPIVFLYRQYLELIIKSIINTARRIQREESGYPKTHKLSTLWNEATSLLRQHYGTQAPEELDRINPCIAEIELHDADSISFRYPTDKAGSPTLRHLAHINLRNLYETMNRLGAFLDCIAADLEHKLECHE